MNIKSLLELESRLDYFSQFSFDIFDTLVFRNVEDHSERELDISKLSSKYLNDLGISCHYKDYMALRDIEFQKSKLITLDEIDYFQSLHNILSQLDIQVDKIECIANALWKIEEEYEASVAYANPEAEIILPIIKNHGKNIIAISDMYLPSSSIKIILEKVGLLNYFDNVYVSSDDKLTKHSGKIYENLLKKGYLLKGNVIHTGDNWHSDEVMPATHSVFGVHYVNEENEKRKIRLAAKLAKKHKFPLHKSTSDFLTLLSEGVALYIKQIFDCAKKNNSKVIYFFTRDSNFLASSAEKYKEKFGIDDIEIRVLHLDRFNSFFLNIRTLSELEKNLWLFGDEDKLNFHDFLHKLGYLDICMKDNEEIILNNKDISLRMALVSNPLKDIILKCILSKNRDVIGYLMKERVFSPDNAVLVDIGYSGTSMREISKFIKTNKSSQQQGRLDCLLFSSNRFFNSNAVLFNEPVHLHLPKIFPFHRVNPFASLNHSWLEPFVLDTRLGPLKRYSEESLEPVRDIYNVEPVFERVQLNLKIESYFESGLDNIDITKFQHELESVIALPSKSQVREYEGLTHIKGFDNSIEQSLLKDVSILNLKKDLKSLVKDDYWIGGSLKKSNLSYLINIACYNMYYVRKILGV